MRPPLPEEITSQDYSDDQVEFQDDDYDILVDDQQLSQQQQGDIYESVTDETEQTAQYQHQEPESEYTSSTYEYDYIQY